MQEVVKALNNSLWRKIIIIVFLPIIVMVWMMGWTLIQIVPTWESTKIKQTATHAPPEFEVLEESEIPKVEEDSRIANEPIMS